MSANLLLTDKLSSFGDSPPAIGAFGSTEVFSAFNNSKDIQFILKSSGHLLTCSEAAREFLETSRIFRIEDGCLTMRQEASAKSFRFALQKGGPSVLLVADEDDLAQPFGIRLQGQGTVWCVVRQFTSRKDTDSIDNSAAHLRFHFVNAFGLTPSEKKIAVELLANKPLKEIGELSGISYETARTHKRRIFAKMGVSSTTELLARVIYTLV